MEASVISLGVAAAAVALALLATVALARQRPRAVRAAQSRHPAATPPVAISLVRDARQAHWRVDVRASAPPTAVDIISYRAAGVAGEWENEPIVEPVELQPGGWAVLPNAIAGRAPAYDVVMGWTEHHPDGDRTGSGSFTVHETGPVIAFRPGPQRGWVAAAAVLAVMLVGAGVIVLARLADEWGDDTVATAPPSSGAVATEVATVPPTVPVSSKPVAPTPVSGAPATSTPASSTTPTADTTIATTVATSTTVATTTTTTDATTSTTTDATTSTTVATTSTTSTTTIVGPVVTATGRIEECRFGPDCLVVGFSISGFDSRPDEYVCEFGDGERVTFSFVGDGAETACSARSADPSITIEVAGVRSAAVTPDDLGETAG